MIKWLRTLLAAIGAVLAAATLVPPQAYAGFLAKPWTEATGSVLVVLGGDSIQDGSLGESTFWRCVFAAEIWPGSGFKQILLSGDPATVNSMRDYLAWRGIPASAMILETGSLTTRENAVNTAKLLRGVPGPVVLMTSDYHSWRAVRAFRKAGLAVTPRYSPDLFKRASDWRDRWRVFLDVMTEFAKIGYYRVRGWI